MGSGLGIVSCVYSGGKWANTYPAFQTYAMATDVEPAWLALLCSWKRIEILNDPRPSN